MNKYKTNILLLHMLMYLPKTGKDALANRKEYKFLKNVRMGAKWKIT